MLEPEVSMIEIAPGIALDESEVHEEFIRASGPGGQHVNKTSSAVQLRFNVLESPSLPERVRARLVRQLGPRLTAEGEVVLTAQEHRSQVRNRQEALDRLVALIVQATIEPKKRRKTRPSRASQQERVEKKRLHSQKKQTRTRVRPSDD